MSCLAEWLSASQEVLCSMKLIYYLFFCTAQNGLLYIHFKFLFASEVKTVPWTQKFSLQMESVDRQSYIVASVVFGLCYLTMLYRLQKLFRVWGDMMMMMMMMIMSGEFERIGKEAVVVWDETSALIFETRNKEIYLLLKSSCGWSHRWPLNLYKVGMFTSFW
jgi:hypothetical protein